MPKVLIRAFICLLLCNLTVAQQPKIKVIADQDSGGPRARIFCHC